LDENSNLELNQETLDPVNCGDCQEIIRIVFSNLTKKGRSLLSKLLPHDHTATEIHQNRKKEKSKKNNLIDADAINISAPDKGESSNDISEKKELSLVQADLTDSQTMPQTVNDASESSNKNADIMSEITNVTSVQEDLTDSQTMPQAVNDASESSKKNADIMSEITNVTSVQEDLTDSQTMPQTVSNLNENHKKRKSSEKSSNSRKIHNRERSLDAPSKDNQTLVIPYVSQSIKKASQKKTVPEDMMTFFRRTAKKEK